MRGFTRHAHVFAAMDRSIAKGEMEIPVSDLRELLRVLPGLIPTGMQEFLQTHQSEILKG